MQIIEVALFTADVAAVTEFYRVLLGCDPDDEGPEKAQFHLGEVTLLIHQSAGDGRPPDPERPGRRADQRAGLRRSATTPPAEAAWPPDEDHVAFGVEDLAAACRAALARGVEPFAGPRAYPWGRSAYFQDPDGRVVELHEKS